MLAGSMARSLRGTLSSLALLTLLGGCAGASEPPPATTRNAPSPSPSVAPPSPGPALPPPGVHVSAPACGYGGSAPAVSVFVDVTTDLALTDVTLSFTLTDATSGAPRGLSREPATLVVSPTERGLLDFSTQGTSPFDGALAAGSTTRLEYFAGLGEAPGAPIPPGAIGGPLRVNVVVQTAQGVFTTSCDTAQMWPSS